MLKLIFGIIFLLLSFLFLCTGYIFIQRNNESGLKLVQLIFTALAILVDIFGFIIPGASDIFVVTTGDIHDSIIQSGDGNNATNGDGNNIIDVDGLDSNIVSIDGDSNNVNIIITSTLEGSNSSFEFYETPPPLDINSDIEVVDHYQVGWGDNIGGRESYTLDEVNQGAIDGKIVFNSISDSVIGHEFNFVGARENNGINLGKENIWNDAIEAEEGKTYFVRLYAHNNGRRGETDMAEGVSVRFQIGNMVKVTKNDLALDGFNSGDGYYAVAIYGYINASNATPSEYFDGVKFVSNRPFHLEYLPGTAWYVNNGIGKNDNGCKLSDDVVKSGVLIGYSSLDGQVPGCYSYSSYSGITVYPVFDD